LAGNRLIDSGPRRGARLKKGDRMAEFVTVIKWVGVGVIGFAAAVVTA
jgi:hypothetical protein